MRVLKIIFVCLLFTSTVQSQKKWSERLGGPSFDESMDIDSDIDANVYSVGYFSGIANITGQYIGSSGLYDGYILKNDSIGAVQFLKKIGGAGNDKCLSLDVATNGDFVVTGYFSQSLTIDATTISAVGDLDIFVGKFNSNGNLIWLKSFGGTQAEQGNAIHFDNNGNVVVTGEFAGSCNFGGQNLSAVNNSIDVFILKLDNQGNTQWVKKGSASATDRGVDIDVDDNGGIYVCGEFSDTIEFDVIHNNQMYNAIFLMKYSATGQEQWFRHMGSGSELNAGGIAIQNNNLFLTGDFNGTLYFIINKDPSNSLSGIYENCLFLAKYGLNGNLIWKTASSSQHDVRSSKVVLDNNNEIYVAGDFQCQFSEFADNYGTGVFLSLGEWDNFVASYSQQGNWMEARQFGGHYTDNINGLCLKNNQLVVTGGFIRDYLSPVNPNLYITNGTNNMDYNQFYGGGMYCNDLYYYHYINIMGAEQNSGLHTDAFINANIDFNRSTLDFFSRDLNTPTSCNRPFIEPTFAYSAGNVIISEDSITTCGSPGIQVFHHFYDWWLRPLTTTTWSNGAVNWETGFAQTGFINASYQFNDNCYSWQDTLFITYNVVPEQPLISDNLNFHNGSGGCCLGPIYACNGDTVQLWSPNYDDTMVVWTLNEIPINPNEVQISGNYVVTRTIPNTGCYSNTWVPVVFKDTLADVNPQILIRYNGEIFTSDTLEMCIGESFNVLFYDSITNPNADVNICFPDLSGINWLSSDSMYNAEIGGYLTQTNCSAWNIIPIYAGVYLADYFVELNRYNPCGTEVEPVHKRIVFNIHDIEDFSWDFEVLPPVPLCPGAASTFYLSDSTLHARWEYCNDCWSNWEPSAYYPDPGGHNIYVVDTIPSEWGCSYVQDTMLWLEVSEFPQLVIATNPVDAIICPFDSVLISTNSNLIQYWVGPNGNIPPSPGLFYTETPGFYYAVADYGPDCNVVSNTVELIQYNTPYLLASPYGVICNGDPVTLTVQTTEGSVVTWLPPLSGNAMTQTITEIGNYTCSINSCDIYTEITMNIIIDSMDLFIDSDDLDLTFCPNDSLMLFAPDNLATYQWMSPLQSNESSVFVEEPGTYSVIGTSGSGCRDTTQITVNMFNEYPTITPMEDTTICAKKTAFLHAESDDLIFWSHENVYNNAFAMGNNFTTDLLYQNTTFYVYASTTNCQTPLYPVHVNVDRHCREIEIPNIITPNGDGENDCFPSDRYDYGLDLQVYNRWGKLIYEEKNLKGGWNGKTKSGENVNHGTYYYILQATFFDGSHEIYRGEFAVLSDKND